MHEILNGLNPRGDARLLEALGLERRRAEGEEATSEASRQSEIVIRRCARLVARRVHAHSANDARASDHREKTMTRRE